MKARREWELGCILGVNFNLEANEERLLNRKMGRLVRQGKRLVKFFDMFSTPNMLRFENEPEYKSMSGACVSLSLIFVFLIIFTNTVISTFNYTNITSTVTQGEETEPSFFSTLNTPFLFAIGLTNINLNDPNTKYFNILFSAKTQFGNGTKITTSVSLVPCQRSSWNAVDASFGQAYDHIGFQNWLCLPSNLTLQFQGKYSSNIFKYVKISVQNCSIGAGDNRTCASSTFIDNFIKSSGSVTLNYYFINTVLNPQDSQYLSYYLEDRNYFTFTRTLGMTANVFISTFTVDTDQSLWPITAIGETTGGMVYEPTQTFIYQPSSDYIQLYLRKSSLSLSVTRAFQKVDDTLSYIGGLFSTLLAFLFFMGKFSECGFEIRIASFLYKQSQNCKVKENYFNLLTFLPYCVYSLLDSFGKTPRWELMQHFHEVREEVGKQLDFPFLIRRIQFLEESLTYLFDDYQLSCLHLKKKMTLEEAAEKRKIYSSTRRLLKAARKRTTHTGKPQRINTIIFNSQLIQVASSQQTGDAGGLSEQSDSDQSSSMDEAEEKVFVEQSMRSLQMLEWSAKQGDKRSQRIYARMHKDFLAILQTNRGQTPPVIENESQQQQQPHRPADNYHFDFDSIANIE